MSTVSVSTALILSAALISVQGPAAVDAYNGVLLQNKEKGLNFNNTNFELFAKRRTKRWNESYHAQ